jgi:hypothetical protein
MGFMQFPVLVVLGLIVLSLASGMFFLAKDDGKGDRVVTSLTFRVILSLILFAMLIAGSVFDVIEPNTLTPSTMLPVPE